MDSFCRFFRIPIRLKYRTKFGELTYHYKWGSLVHIDFIRVQARSKGHGSQLVQDFIKSLSGKGIRRIDLVPYYSQKYYPNDKQTWLEGQGRLVRFYLRLGFHEYHPGSCVGFGCDELFYNIK